MDEGTDQEAQAVHQAIEGELRSPDPHARASRGLAGRLLDAEFTKVGRSGRKWDRDSLLDALATMDGPPPPSGASRVRVTDMVGKVPTPGLVHLTHTTQVGDTHTLRSSLWRRAADGVWRLYHHQGTPTT